MKTVDRERPFPVIGLTGKIAGGKSEVRKILESEGFLGIDADRVGHAVLTGDREVIDQLVSHFGGSILTQNPAEEPIIDRRKLAEIVFADPAKLQKLDQLTHPAITAAIQDRIESAGCPVVIEAIKLIQSGINRLCDEIWLVKTDDAIRFDRLLQTRGLSRQEAFKRINAQAGLFADESVFSAVIDGGQPLESVRRVVEENLNRLKTVRDQ